MYPLCYLMIKAKRLNSNSSPSDWSKYSHQNLAIGANYPLFQSYQSAEGCFYPGDGPHLFSGMIFFFKICMGMDQLTNSKQLLFLKESQYLFFQKKKKKSGKSRVFFAIVRKKKKNLIGEKSHNFLKCYFISVGKQQDKSKNRNFGFCSSCYLPPKNSNCDVFVSVSM